MPFSRRKIAQLLALVALLAAAHRLARASSTPAPPTQSGATTADLQDPDVVSPKEPSVKCLARLSEEERNRTIKQGRLSSLSDDCLPQADAFVRAAEASSYLAFYQQHFSNFGETTQNPIVRMRYKQAIRDCLAGSDCDPKKRADLLKALVQYNFGKELKAQMLENTGNAERMKSVDQAMTRDDWRQLYVNPTKLLQTRPQKRRYERDTYRAANSGSLRRKTFRLDPRNLGSGDLRSASQQERALLGESFKRDFRQFVENYTSSAGKSRWHYNYVPAASAAVGGDGKRYVPAMGRDAETKINETRLNADTASQSRPEVQEIVTGFRESLKRLPSAGTTPLEVEDEDGSTSTQEEEALSVAANNVGFGLPRSHLRLIGKGGPNAPSSPADVAANVVIQINSAITKAERKNDKEQGSQPARLPSSPQDSLSPGAPPENTRINSVMVDVKEFHKFLNGIWPAAPPK